MGKKKLRLSFLCYNLPYYAKKLEKYAPILPWLKFKHGHPWKTVQCDNIFATTPSLSVFSPITSSNQTFLEHTKAISYSLQKKLFNSVLHVSIGNNLTLALKGFVIASQIFNLTPNLSFDHNSCILDLNEQCDSTLGIYTSRPFQWYHRGPIWCLLTFPTKVLNSRDSRMNVIPKVGMHLGVVVFHRLHSPPFVRVCFTPKHTLLASWALALHT